MEKRHFVSLPDPVPLTDPGMTNIASDAPAQLDTPTATTSKLPGNNTTTQSQERPTAGGNPATSNAAPKHALTTTMHQAGMGPRQAMPRPQQPQQPGVWPRSMQVNNPNNPNQQQMQYTLRRIQKEHLERQTNIGPYTMPRPSAYSGPMMSQMHMHRSNQVGAYNPAVHPMQRTQRMPMHVQMTPEQRQLYMQRVRIRQQQQQQAQAQAAAAAQMMSAPPYNPPYQQQMAHPQMVQPAPPMQVQQPMQHGYNQQMMVRQQFPQQPNAPMNPIQRPMY